jgi:RNA polymerase sigma factor (sigma-70 family)
MDGYDQEPGTMYSDGNVGSVTVAALVRQAQDGDRLALERLHDRFAPAIRAIGLRLTRNTDDADDVAQETWLRVLRLLGQVREPERFPGWVRTIAQREALRILRARSRVVELDRTQAEARVGDGDGDVADTVIRNDEGSRVREAMARLPRDRARLLTETVVEQRSYREVSARVGRPIGSLGPLRARYLGQLRRELARQGVVAAR